MDALIGATLVLVYAVALAGLLLLFRCSHDGLWIFPFAKPGSRVARLLLWFFVVLPVMLVSHVWRFFAQVLPQAWRAFSGEWGDLWWDARDLFRTTWVRAWKGENAR